MKYIRTKETEYGCIIDTIKYKEQTGEECYIPKNEIVKSADNIEDLFDGVLMVTHSAPLDFLKHQFIDFFSDSIMNGIKNHHCEVYGAIWTDKGLIYVAKLNDKGEWELL